MNTRKFGVLFGIIVLAAICTISITTRNQQLATRNQIEKFVSQHNLQGDDLQLFYRAHERAFPCRTERCDPLWERWGTQDYYSNPFVVSFWNEAGDGEFLIETGREFVVRGKNPEIEPRFALYYRSRGNMWRWSADGKVHRLIGEEWTIDSSAGAAEMTRHLRSEALRLLRGA